MSNLSKEEVEHIAKLANLDLNDQEKDKFAKQLAKILDYIEKISSVNTEKAQPLFNAVKIKNISREDEVKPSLTKKDALANAHSIYQGYFKVKAVLEE